MNERENAPQRWDRPQGRRKKWIAGISIAMLVVAAFAGAPFVQVYRDWAFICENTGSRKGYRQWCIGLRSGHWYHESRLEQFMRQEHSSDLRNCWTSYAGTGKSVFGTAILYSHESPGPIINIPEELLDWYVDTLDDKARLSLYHLFSSRQREKIEKEIAGVWEQAIASDWDVRTGGKGHE